jgi:hypothetical protein
MSLLFFSCCHKFVPFDVWYRGCQKNVPIEDRFSVTNPYAAILFSEQYSDNSYNIKKGRQIVSPFLFFLKPNT